MRRVTADGIEATFQVDHLAPYMLCYLLEPLLIASAPSRIVNVASAGQAPINFDDLMREATTECRPYCQAKLADVMLTIDRAAETGTRVTVGCLHPALNMPTKILTQMFHAQSELADGVRSTVRLMTDPTLENVTGRYFDHNQELTLFRGLRRVGACSATGNR